MTFSLDKWSITPVNFYNSHAVFCQDAAREACKLTFERRSADCFI